MITPATSSLARGIREIEFIVQALQLFAAAGSRRAAVRCPRSLRWERGCSRAPPSPVRRRTCSAQSEHRLQYRDDRQTHDVPMDPAEQAARGACGTADVAALTAVRSAATRSSGISMQCSVRTSPTTIRWRRSGSTYPRGTPSAPRRRHRLRLAFALIESLARVRQSALPAIDPVAATLDALVPGLRAAVAATGVDRRARSGIRTPVTLLETTRRAASIGVASSTAGTPRLAELMAASAWAADTTRHPPSTSADSRVPLAEPDWARGDASSTSSCAPTRAIPSDRWMRAHFSMRRRFGCWRRI